MANYLLAYHGGGGMAETPAAQAAAMAEWGKWFQDLGPAVVDGGNPVSKTQIVMSAGKPVPEGAGSHPISGYSVIKADSMEAAVKMVQGCPVLAAGGGIEVCETFNAM